MIEGARIFSLIAIFIRLKIINLGFSGAVFTLSRHVKLVDSGADNMSHCLVLYATGSLTFDLIAL